MTHAEEKRTDPRKSVNQAISFELLMAEKDKLRNVQVNGLCSDISRYGLGLTRTVLSGTRQYFEVTFLYRTEYDLAPLCEGGMVSSADADFKAGLRFVA